MGRPSKMDDIELLEVMRQRLSLFRKLCQDIIDTVQNDLKTTNDHLQHLLAHQKQLLQVVKQQIRSLNDQISQLFYEKKQCHDYEGAHFDRERIQHQINGLIQQREVFREKKRRIDQKISEIKELITLLRYQRHQQYEPYGEKKLKNLVRNNMARGIKSLDQIHHLLLQYLQTSSPVITSSISGEDIARYQEKKHKEYTVQAQKEEEKDQINTGRKIFDDVEVKKEGGVKIMKVGYKRIDHDFNEQTLMSLEKEALERKCRYISIRAYGEHVNYFENQGYERGKDLWLGTKMRKDLWGDNKIPSNQRELPIIDK